MTEVAQTPEFQMVDTQQIQLDSLVAVMDAVGYRFDRIGAEGDKRKATGGFVTDNPALQANRNLSNTTAVKIHNAPRKQWVKVQDGWYKLDIPGIDLVMSAYALNLLFARKLVEKVKFVKTRKSPSHFMLQSHMVKPANRAYIPLLGLTA